MKITFWIVDISVVLFSTLFVTLSLLSLSMTSYNINLVMEYSLNWNSAPIQDIIKINSTISKSCPDNYEYFLTNSFPSFSQGCNCLDSNISGLHGNVFNKQCTLSHIAYGCKNIFPLGSTPINVWKNSRLCVKRMNTTYINLLNEITKRGTNNCESHQKKCGLLDSSGNILCLNRTEECPINGIIVTQNLTSKGYQSIDISSDTTLFYTRESTSNKILANTTLSQVLPCADLYEGMLGENTYILNNRYGPSSCVTDVSTFLFDTRYNLLDSDLMTNFFNYNNIDLVINQLPLYPQPSPTESVLMAYSSFFGISNSCVLSNANINFSQLIFPSKLLTDLTTKITTVANIAIVHFVITLIFISLFKVSYSKFQVNPKMQMIFDLVNLCVICLILGFGITAENLAFQIIEPYKTFMSMGCGDVFTNFAFNSSYYPLLQITSFLKPISICCIIDLSFIGLNYLGYFIITKKPFLKDIEYS